MIGMGMVRPPHPSGQGTPNRSASSLSSAWTRRSAGQRRSLSTRRCTRPARWSASDRRSGAAAGALLGTTSSLPDMSALAHSSLDGAKSGPACRRSTGAPSPFETRSSEANDSAGPTTSKAIRRGVEGGSSANAPSRTTDTAPASLATVRPPGTRATHAPASRTRRGTSWAIAPAARSGSAGAASGSFALGREYGRTGDSVRFDLPRGIRTIDRPADTDSKRGLCIPGMGRFEGVLTCGDGAAGSTPPRIAPSGAAGGASIIGSP